MTLTCWSTSQKGIRTSQKQKTCSISMETGVLFIIQCTVYSVNHVSCSPLKKMEAKWEKKRIAPFLFHIGMLVLPQCK